MIESKALLADLKKQLKLLQADLREKAEDPADAWGQRLKEQHRAALERGRTGHPWVTWRDAEVEQAAVAWLIASTFVRFCEDNDLLDGARDEHGRPVPTVWLAGPGERLALAVEHETEYFTGRPSANRRDWVQEAFHVLAALPAGRALVDPDHSLVWTALMSAEAADRLVGFWRTTDASGRLVHDFTDPSLDTRFLGDLYQDLSDYAKKTFALLQTPEFVEEFILDQTLTPAVEEFGIAGLKLIDATCGSGHFLLGAFTRLNQLWTEQAPALDVRERVRRAMDSIHGVDLNPFAVAIARFRLTVAGLRAAGLRSLVEAPELGYHLAVGDSLLGAHQAQLELDLGMGEQNEADVFQYDQEDLTEYHGILKAGQYHVVVGNPPYITVKDKALNQIYREAYTMAAGKYALSVPFLELFFRLAIKGDSAQGAGYVGQITSNSFMKREFGKKVIETLLAGQDLGNPVDLNVVVDSSGAWMPGHNFDGTPTVILVGRRRRPTADVVRVVAGKKDDAGKLTDPANGPVWREIIGQLSHPGYEGTYVSVTDVGRAVLGKHPWSLSGGGAAALKEMLDAAATSTPARLAFRVGVFGIQGADEAFMSPPELPRRIGAVESFAPVVSGDQVRDFQIRRADPTFFPYDDGHTLQPLSEAGPVGRRLWPLRTELGNRATFSKRTYFDEGRPWYEWHQIPRDLGAHAWALTFAEVATHNHFVLDRGGRVFKQTAPVIKLHQSATEHDHLALLGLLNSSTAAYWLKQVAQKKGGDADVPWLRTYQFNSKKVGQFPLPAVLPVARGRLLEDLARKQQETSPRSLLESTPKHSANELSFALTLAEERWHRLRARMIFEQEELDWEVYRLYGLIDEDLIYSGPLPKDERLLHLGERAFEIALARKVADGVEETAWFERHGSTPLTAVPSQWPAEYRALVERRLELLASDRAVGLLEHPEFKRRWATPGWDALLQEALAETILDRLEQRDLWFDASGQPTPRSVAELADGVRHDGFLVGCVNALAGSAETNLTTALVDLLKDQPVPYLAALRLKELGVEKYREWQRVWDLQRREDAGEKVTIPVPPKYEPGEFLKTSYWRARGKLDMPKERFIDYPGAQRTGDRTPVIGWAGWDHAEQAQALAREAGTQRALGADAEQLTPLVAGLVELEPWLDQWHSELDPRYGTSPAAAIRQTVEHHLALLGTTRAELDAWRPPAPSRGRKAGTAGTVGAATKES